MPSPTNSMNSFWSGIVLTAVAPEFSVNFRMTPDATISGLVFDEAGEAVRNAQVQIERVRRPGPNEGLRGTGGGSNALTDDRGHYELTGLQPGEYRLRVDAQPWYATRAQSRRSANGGSPAPPPDPSLDVVYAQTWYPAATDEASAETISLAGGEERQADFHLTPIPSIHLRIPIPAAAGGSNDADRPRGERAPMVTREGGTWFLNLNRGYGEWERVGYRWAQSGQLPGPRGEWR